MNKIVKDIDTENLNINYKSACGIVSNKKIIFAKETQAGTGKLLITNQP